MIDMESKLFEVRDRATFIPVLAVRFKRVSGLSPDNDYLAKRIGAVEGTTVLVSLNRQAAHDDPSEWGGRTYPVAHAHIAAKWDELPSGSVVDVEYVLGEVDKPKTTERLWVPGESKE